MENTTETKPRRGPRPRSIEDEWFDIFMTWEPADQAAAIRLSMSQSASCAVRLSALAQLQRQQKRGKLEPAKQGVLTEGQAAAEI